VERPGLPTLLIEIKSGKLVREEETRNLASYSKTLSASQAICLYQGEQIRRVGEVDVYPWQTGLKEFGIF